MSQAIRVATYNIHRCVGRDGRRDPARIAAVLEEIAADVVALQEVEWTAGGAGPSLQMEYFAKRLRMEALPGPTIEREETSYGNVLLTRLDVGEVRRLDLSCARCEPRGAVDADLLVDGTELRVVATHLGLMRNERHIQAMRLLEALAAGSGPMIVLLGDLNEWSPWGGALRLLWRRFEVVTGGATFPTLRPCLPLDRILVTPASLFTGSRVHRSVLARVASDHFPAVADLVRRAQGPVLATTPHRRTRT